jgi:signal transduction histidine kinase
MNVQHREMDFIATVTHDLKSPLGAILSAIELIKRDIHAGVWDRKALLEDLTIAEDCAGELLDLVQNMLTAARIQAGEMSVYPKLLSRPEFIEQLKGMERTFRYEARARMVNFSVGIGELPVQVHWDIQKIRFFAINNLISNALKFVGQDGTVKVFVDSDESGDVRITVADNGPGIPEAERKSVFLKFVQASNNCRNYNGGGYGLFNAGRTISLHHGSIEILDGLNGRGVTFKASIPSQPFAHRDPSPAAPANRSRPVYA